MMTTVRFRLVDDYDADLSYLAETKAEYRDNGPLMIGATVAGNPGTPMRWKDYRETYGNPEHYVSFGLILDTRCDCCGTWNEGSSLWGLDYYVGPIPDGAVDAVTGEPARMVWPSIGSYTVEELAGEDPYLAEVAQDLLAEDGAA